MNKEQTKKNIWLEILRFIVVGGGATIIDFVCEWGILALIGNKMGETSAWPQVIAVTVGFLVSTIFNYLLSLVWVFQNVKDEKKAHSKSYMVYFVILSAIGLGIGIGLQALGQWICQANFSININEVKFSNIFSQAAGPFWAFVIVFVLKTCVTLVYNYLSRKLILFRAPKIDEAKENSDQQPSESSKKH
ncbi:MAG: GtrA-like protein [Tenericutes bacterium ADurb.BinA155]|jgi:putative flippase GtrA|nr:MAG: GtrA-like protein [Tenericutes bacterium ADurb.BinA155]